MAFKKRKLHKPVEFVAMYPGKFQTLEHSDIKGVLKRLNQW
ncbi:26016_t:CDS:1, partial [Dentiscutata erythropus]